MWPIQQANSAGAVHDEAVSWTQLSQFPTFIAMQVALPQALYILSCTGRLFTVGACHGVRSLSRCARVTHSHSLFGVPCVLLSRPSHCLTFASWVVLFVSLQVIDMRQVGLVLICCLEANILCAHGRFDGLSMWSSFGLGFWILLRWRD
ncbi:hypothetical protein M758_2G040700 [Ceratodon purpureus]|nr:hypothetical protein M758_2G040700 [Ceratodon purpureus]